MLQIFYYWLKITNLPIQKTYTEINLSSQNPLLNKLTISKVLSYKTHRFA